jgi:hypothetical protein
VLEKGYVVVEVTYKASDCSRVIELSYEGEIKAMEMKRQGEKCRVKGKGEVEVAMNLACNSHVDSYSIRAQKWLIGETGVDLGDKALSHKSTEQSEW